MEGPGEHHRVTQQTTAVDGVSYVDCTRSPDRGGNSGFQVEVGIDLATSRVAARHFVKLAMFQQQRGMTARSIYKGGKLYCSSTLRGEPGNTNKRTSHRS